MTYILVMCTSTCWLLFGHKSLKTIQTSLCRVSYVGCQHDTACICCRAPCCGAAAADRRPCSNRSISPARRAHSSKPAAAECGGRIMGQTDRRTDGRPLHRRRCAYYSMRAASITECVVKIHTKNKQLLLLDNIVIQKMWSRCYQLQAKRKYIFCILLCHPWPIRNVYAVTATNVKSQNKNTMKTEYDAIKSSII